MAVGLMLGLDLCSTHECRCGSVVDARGLHNFVCKKTTITINSTFARTWPAHPNVQLRATLLFIVIANCRALPLHTHRSSAPPEGPLGGLPSLSLTTESSWIHLWGGSPNLSSSHWRQYPRRTRAAVHQVLGSTILQAPTNCDSKLILNTLMDGQPV